MNVEFQILVPGFHYDLAHGGKGPSHGWAFFTSYNTEQANTLLEVNASQNDKDFIAAVNWKKAEEYVAQGKAKTFNANYFRNYFDEKKHMGFSEEKRLLKFLFRRMSRFDLLSADPKISSWC
jgi:nitrous-oxide reductase